MRPGHSIIPNSGGPSLCPPPHASSRPRELKPEARRGRSAGSRVYRLLAASAGKWFEESRLAVQSADEASHTGSRGHKLTGHQADKRNRQDDLLLELPARQLLAPSTAGNYIQSLDTPESALPLLGG